MLDQVILSVRHGGISPHDRCDRSASGLLEMAELVEAPDEERAVIQGWIERGLRGLEECWDPELGLCLDHDLYAERPLRVRTVAGFAPLIAGHLNPERLKALLSTLESPAFAGHPGLRWPLPPSTSP